MKEVIAIVLVLALLASGCASNQTSNTQDTNQVQETTGVDSDIQDSNSLEQDLDTLDEDIDLGDLNF